MGNATNISTPDECSTASCHLSRARLPPPQTCPLRARFRSSIWRISRIRKVRSVLNFTFLLLPRATEDPEAPFASVFLKMRASTLANACAFAVIIAGANAQDFSYVCLDPADYDGSKEYTYKNDDGTTGTSTCDGAIASNLAPDKPLKDEDFSRAWSCEGKSSAVTDLVQAIANLGCCGANRKSACWVDRSNVCADPSKFLPWNNFKSEDGSFDGTCDFAVHAISDDNMDSCYGEDFSKTWSCSGKSSSCQAQLLELARGGCCGSAGQSASACHGHYSGAGSFTQVGIFAVSMAVAIALA